MKILTDEEVIDRAKKWARLHRNVNTRGRMDECLDGLSKADARRVYLCGQRVAAGLTVKVIPAATTPQKGVKPHDNDSKTTKAVARRERHHATKQGAQGA